LRVGPVTWLLVATLVAVVIPAVLAAEKLVFWHGMSADLWEAVRPLVQEFGAKSGVQVEASQVSWQGTRDRLLSRMAGGYGPDAIMLPSSGWEALTDFLADLGPMLKSDRSFDLADFLPASLWVWQAFGRQYALPWSNDVAVFWYHPGLVAAAGLSAPRRDWDWSNWLQYAQKMTVDLDGDGRRDRYGWLEWFTHTFLTLVWANDADFFIGGQPSWHMPQVREALTFYADFYPPRKNVTLLWDELAHVGIDPLQGVYPSAAFAQGRVAMLAAGTWFADTYVTQADGATAQWALAQWPKSPKGKRATSLEGQGLAVTATSRRPDSAYKFLKWLVGVKGQALVAEAGQIPVRASVLTGGTFLRQWPSSARNQVVETCRYARPVARDVNWPRLMGPNQPLRTAVYDFLHGRHSWEQARAKLDQSVLPLLPKVNR
jgi:multiple sugar transport system substrate-binding protein